MKEGSILILQLCFLYLLPIFLVCSQSTFLLVPNLYLVLLAVFSDYGIIPVSMLEVVI